MLKKKGPDRDIYNASAITDLRRNHSRRSNSSAVPIGLYLGSLWHIYFPLMSYIRRNGLRAVAPYYGTKYISCRGRWFGRLLEQVLSTEFLFNSDAYFVRDPTDYLLEEKLTARNVH